MVLSVIPPENDEANAHPATASRSSASSALPRISVVTPSLNQGRFIKDNFRAMAAQDYPDLEQIVMDAVSTDETPAILEKWKPRLTHVVIGKDEGQYDAINKGFALATGEVMAWLNADDIYLPGALRTVGSIFAAFPEVEWLTTRIPMAIEEDGALIKATPVYGFTKSGFMQGDNLAAAGWPAVCFIQQESTFWRASLWRKVGGRIDTSMHYAGDFDLWARFFQHAQLYAVDVPLACFRRHETQKSSVAFATYLEEAKRSLANAGGGAPGKLWQSARMALRKGLPSQAQDWLEQRNILTPAPCITYDWGAKRWKIGRA